MGVVVTKVMDLLNNGQLLAIRLDNVGHFPMIEAWDTYIESVEGFLTTD